MYSEKQIDKEIVRLKAGKKTRIYTYVATMISLILLDYIDDDPSSTLIIVFFIVIGVVFILNEIQKRKIVERLMRKE